MLSEGDRALLAQLERQLRRQAPALNQALRDGTLTSLGTPRQPCGWQAWPVVLMVAVGGTLFGLGLLLLNGVALLVGAYMIFLCRTGLRLPLLRPPLLHPPPWRRPPGRSC